MTEDEKKVNKIGKQEKKKKRKRKKKAASFSYKNLGIHACLLPRSYFFVPYIAQWRG